MKIAKLWKGSKPKQVTRFGQHDGKVCYRIQKDISKNYSGTGPRVSVTLGPTHYSKGPVPCSEARAWGVCFICHIYVFYWVNY